MSRPVPASSPASPIRVLRYAEALFLEDPPEGEATTSMLVNAAVAKARAAYIFDRLQSRVPRSMRQTAREVSAWRDANLWNGEVLFDRIDPHFSLFYERELLHVYDEETAHLWFLHLRHVLEACEAFVEGGAPTRLAFDLLCGAETLLEMRGRLKPMLHEDAAFHRVEVPPTGFVAEFFDLFG